MMVLLHWPLEWGRDEDQRGVLAYHETLGTGLYRFSTGDFVAAPRARAIPEEQLETTQDLLGSMYRDLPADVPSIYLERFFHVRTLIASSDPDLSMGQITRVQARRCLAVQRESPPPVAPGFFLLHVDEEAAATSS